MSFVFIFIFSRRCNYMRAEIKIVVLIFFIHIREFIKCVISYIGYNNVRNT